MIGIGDAGWEWKGVEVGSGTGAGVGGKMFSTGGVADKKGVSIALGVSTPFGVSIAASSGSCIVSA